MSPNPLGAIDVMYVDDSNGTFKVVFDPEMRPTHAELAAAIKAIEAMNGVYSVQYQTGGDNFAFSVQFSHGVTADQKSAAYTALNPAYVFGKAWGRVVRSDDGMHRNTLLCISVSQRAGEIIASRLGNVTGCKQVTLRNEDSNGWPIIAIAFTAMRPTRDVELNRKYVRDVAEQLGVRLNNEQFGVDDSLVWAAMAECNLANDPIDEQSD